MLSDSVQRHGQCWIAGGCLESMWGHWGVKAEVAVGRQEIPPRRRWSVVCVSGPCCCSLSFCLSVLRCMLGTLNMLIDGVVDEGYRRSSGIGNFIYTFMEGIWSLNFWPVAGLEIHF